MCGISGIWLSNKKVEHAEIINFNNAIEHRGPDGHDVYLGDGEQLALGHRRLSIIDLSDMGKQPMTDTSERYVITYNGEIFNYVELKEELRSKGHSFRSRTDTEVILAAYKEWGEDCLYKLNGMWAFAIWDKQQKELFISRDRYGIKPLYYISKHGEYFAFASETIAFKHLRFFNRTLSNKNVTLGISDTFYLENIGETLYKNLYSLKPGHKAIVTQNKVLEITKWWDIKGQVSTVPSNYEHQIEEFRDLLDDSCKLRLRSDVTIGTALSGGVDSSSVYSTIQTLRKNSEITLARSDEELQAAFIASFPGTSMDEKEYADKVVDFHGGTAKYIYPNLDTVADEIERQVRSEDFIYMSPPVIHNIYKKMKENGVTVSLDGHGVDEMLFGYPKMLEYYYPVAENEAEKSMLIDTLHGLTLEPETELRKRLSSIQIKQKSFLGEVRSMAEKVLPESVLDIYRQRKHDNKHFHRSYKPVDLVDRNMQNYPPDFPVVYNYFTLFLPTLLRNWDRASMQHGVEIRMPFMDYRLVSYVFGLPFASKVNDGYTKKILRDAMKGRVPDSVINRKHKIGINAPTAEWFNSVLNTYVSDVVNSKSFVESGIWNGPNLKKYAEKRSAEKSWTHSDCVFFWPILNAWILSDAAKN